MKKYKQTYIPEVKRMPKVTCSAKLVASYYKEHIQGKTVVNKHTGLTIYFGSDGKAELAHGRATYSKKVAVLQCLPRLLEVAEYNNWGNRKKTDEKYVFGYANFKAKVRIDGKLECARITVVVKANGKAYYNHEISIKK